MSGPASTLVWLHELLDRLAIPHMIVGSFASSAHGAPRTTQDIDVVIDPTGDQLAALVDAIDVERFYVDADAARDALRRRTMFNVIDLESGWKIDLVIRKATAHAVEELDDGAGGAGVCQRVRDLDDRQRGEVRPAAILDDAACEPRRRELRALR